MGIQSPNVKLWVRDPPKGTSLRETASFNVFFVSRAYVGAGVLAVGDWRNPKKSKNNRDRGMRKIAHAQKQNLGVTDLDFYRAVLATIDVIIRGTRGTPIPPLSKVGVLYPEF